MANGRVQAPELRGNLTLRPALIKSDTFVSPAQPPQPEALRQLAAALAPFSSSLGALAQTMKPTEEERQREHDMAMGRINGMSFAEQNEASATGKIPVHAQPFTNAAIRKVFGNTAGRTLAGEVQQEMETGGFNWDDGDPDAYVTAKANAFLESNKYGQDPHFVAGFWSNMNPLRTQVESHARERKTAGFIAEQEQAAFEWIDATVRHEAEGGTDPKTIATRVWAQVPHLGKSGALGLPDERTELEIVNVVRRIVDTHPEVALALLEHPRQGRDGVVRSLSQDRDKQDAVLQIRDAAGRAIGRREEGRFLSETASSDVALLMDGRGDEIGDVAHILPDGRTVSLSRKERTDAALKSYLSHSKVIATGNRETPEQTLSREMRAVNHAGLKHTEVESRLSGISDLMTPRTLGDPEAMTKVLDKFQLYRMIKREGVHAVQTYTTEKDRDAAETFLWAIDTMGMSKEQAMESTIRYANGPDRSDLAGTAVIRKGVADAVGELSSRKGWLGFDVDSDPSNYSLAQARVIDTAERLVGAGAKPEDAVKQAVERIKSTSVVHNGTLLDLSGVPIPENFPDAVDETLVKFLELNPKAMESGQIAAEDLTILPVGGDAKSGAFIIVDKDNLSSGLKMDDGRLAVVTLDDIRRVTNERRAEERNALVRRDNLKSEAGRRGLVSIRDLEGKVNWIDPASREVYSLSFRKDSTSPAFKKTGKRYKKGDVLDVYGGFDLDGPTQGATGADLKRLRSALSKARTEEERENSLREFHRRAGGPTGFFGE